MQHILSIMNSCSLEKPAKRAIRSYKACLLFYAMDWQGGKPRQAFIYKTVATLKELCRNIAAASATLLWGHSLPLRH